MVAKSYQKLEIITEPYEAKGRMYVKVRTVAGEPKQVRWYSDAEYSKLYGESVAPTETAAPISRKKVLGFENGYITLFKGDTYANKDWFKASVARYATLFGWYVASTDEVPAPLPVGIEAVRLDWETIQQDGDISIPDDEIKKIVEGLIYEPSDSEWVGELKERLEFDAECTRAYDMESYYGINTMHTFKDDAGNVYLWTTATKHLEEGVRYHIRGTVKEHGIYRNTKQTILSRCTAVVID